MSQNRTQRPWSHMLGGVVIVRLLLAYCYRLLLAFLLPYLLPAAGPPAACLPLPAGAGGGLTC